MYIPEWKYNGSRCLCPQSTSVPWRFCVEHPKKGHYFWCYPIASRLTGYFSGGALQDYRTKPRYVGYSGSLEEEMHMKDSILFDVRCHNLTNSHLNRSIPKRRLCGILLETQPPIAKVRWDCSERVVSVTQKHGTVPRSFCKPAVRLQRDSSSSADWPRDLRALTPLHSLCSLRGKRQCPPMLGPKGPEQASLIHVYIYIYIYMYIQGRTV